MPRMEDLGDVLSRMIKGVQKTRKAQLSMFNSFSRDGILTDNDEVRMVSFSGIKHRYTITDLVD